MCIKIEQGNGTLLLMSNNVRYRFRIYLLKQYGGSKSDDNFLNAKLIDCGKLYVYNACGCIIYYLRSITNQSYDSINAKQNDRTKSANRVSKRSLNSGRVTLSHLFSLLIYIYHLFMQWLSNIKYTIVITTILSV